MKKLLNVIALSFLVMTPSVSLAKVTGKTLKASSGSADPAASQYIKPGSLIPAVSTPCYAIDEVSDGDITRLLAVAFFFGSGAGADTTASQNADATQAAIHAALMVDMGFQAKGIFAFLKIELAYIYDCD